MLVKSGFITIFICLILSIHCFAEQIMVVTEDWPPFNYEKDGQIVGFATEIVRRTLEKADFKAKFKIFPWARAYKMALNDKNTLIYTISRTIERENHFKWIGPYADRSIFLYKLSSRNDINISSLEDVKKFKIGLMREDATHQYFIGKGFSEHKNLDITSKEDLNIKKLFIGRVDLIAGNEISLKYKFKELGFNYNEISKIFPIIESGGYYMAFSKSTSDEICNKVESSFNQLESGGIIKAIKNNYFNSQ